MSKLRGPGIMLYVVLIGALVMLLFALPTFVVVAVGLVPTLLAVFVDMRTGRREALCVGTLNFAGVLPFIGNLWTTEHSVKRALVVLNDPFAWLVMFGSAGAAFALLALMPKVVRKVVDSFSERRLARIKDRQSRLIKEWGSEIVRDAVG